MEARLTWCNAIHRCDHNATKPHVGDYPSRSDMKFIVALAALAVVAVAVDAAPISGTMPDTVSLSAADLTNTIAGVKKAEV